MNTTLIARIVTLVIVAMALVVSAATVASAYETPQAQIIKRAACIGSSKDTKGSKSCGDGPSTAADGADQTSLNKFTDTADALLNPALLALAGVAPLGCLVGAGSLMFGNRRGLVFIGSSLGTLVFVASLRGIIA